MMRPNHFGMFDMAGANTWQWSLTTGGPRLVEARAEIRDDESWQFSGLSGGYATGDRLLMRGTSMLSFPDLSTSSYRGIITPFRQSDQSKLYYGIRLARTLPATKPH
jgi:formylglycine-generating enzyme required for sulfatase activity